MESADQTHRVQCRVRAFGAYGPATVCTAESLRVVYRDLRTWRTEKRSWDRQTLKLAMEMAGRHVEGRSARESPTDGPTQIPY